MNHLLIWHILSSRLSSKRVVRNLASVVHRLGGFVSGSSHFSKFYQRSTHNSIPSVQLKRLQFICGQSHARARLQPGFCSAYGVGNFCGLQARNELNEYIYGNYKQQI